MEKTKTENAGSLVELLTAWLQEMDPQDLRLVFAVMSELHKPS